MIVAHNLMALNAQRQFNIVSKTQAGSTEKLSSGYKINRAADDAAGLAISEKMRRQIRGLNQGALNIQEGISLVQVADGALNEVDDILQRANELAIKAANGTLNDSDRSYIQEEVDQLVSEIDRIGSTTSFNEIYIFDKSEIEKRMGKLTQLVTSPSADNHKMTESYLASNGKYYPAASIDFSNINSENINKLNNSSFYFICPLGCKEKFEIKFSNDGTGNKVVGQNLNSSHEYTIDISGISSGTQLVDTIYSYISSNLPTRARGSSQAQELTSITGGVGVSHASALVRDGNKLIVISNKQFATAKAAEQYGEKLTSPNGDVNCSQLTKIADDAKLVLPIKCSSQEGDIECVTTRLMNANALSITGLNVSTASAAESSISNIKYAMNYIANLRSDLGAQQNRLEHAYNTNLNTAENTTAAESQIRDTDMAKEMVTYSLHNVLIQVGYSVMSQANQSNQGVLSLLQ